MDDLKNDRQDMARQDHEKQQQQQQMAIKSGEKLLNQINQGILMEVNCHINR